MHFACCRRLLTVGPRRTHCGPQVNRPLPLLSVPALADQHISSGSKGGAAKLSAHQKEEFGFGAEDEGDHGIVVVGASVIPLTAAQRQELGEPQQQRLPSGLLFWLACRLRRS